MAYNLVYKDPAETYSFTADWTDWLKTDTISTSTWAVPTGLTLVTGTKTNTTTTATISGGTLGVNYTLTNTVVTASGRTTPRTYIVRVTSK